MDFTHLSRDSASQNLFWLIKKPKMGRKLRLNLIVLVLVVSSCHQMAEPETYLIHAGYAGRVEILFDQNGIPVKYKNEYSHDTVYTPKMGKAIKYEDGRRVYEIPYGGLLLTQFTGNDGFIDRRYFLVSENGTRTPLEVFELEHYKPDSARWKVKDENEIGIFGDGTSGSYGNMNIPYQFFIISNKKKLDSFYSKNYLTQFENNIQDSTGLILHF